MVDRLIPHSSFGKLRVRCGRGGVARTRQSSRLCSGPGVLFESLEWPHHRATQEELPPRCSTPFDTPDRAKSLALTRHKPRVRVRLVVPFLDPEWDLFELV